MKTTGMEKQMISRYVFQEFMKSKVSEEMLQEIEVDDDREIEEADSRNSTSEEPASGNLDTNYNIRSSSNNTSNDADEADMNNQIGADEESAERPASHIYTAMRGAPHRGRRSQTRRVTIQDQNCMTEHVEI